MVSRSMRSGGSLCLSVVLALSAAAAAGSALQGEVGSGWLGFLYTYEKPTGDAKTENHGAFLFVHDVLSGSPAEKGGLKKEDRILAIDGQQVSRFTREAVAEFFVAVRRGQRVKLAVEREEARRNLELEAVQVPEQYREARERMLRMLQHVSESPPSQSPKTPDADGTKPDVPHG